MTDDLLERRRHLADCLSRCTDLFGQMLLTGKIKALDRQIAALRAQDMRRGK